MPADPDAETSIRAQLEGGDLRGATTATITVYGPELHGFLRGTARDDDLADEAFAQFGEDVWRGLNRFRWDSSLRTWCYTVARNALHRLRRDPKRSPARHVDLSDADISAIAERVRTVTATFAKSEVKDELAVLRNQLDPDDHELLLLRLDRQMSWKEIARIRGGDDNITTRAAALRKRFERAKDRLRELALENGLL
jgi:RNA polymerase sigma-70 factor (ECF subfamily)